jgi:hypothetical protein
MGIGSLSVIESQRKPEEATQRRRGAEGKERRQKRKQRRPQIQGMRRITQIRERARRSTSLF